jgi:tRNA(Ile)-lysidine synthase
MTAAVPAVRNAVRHWLEKYEAGDKVLVAVSGGADSLALAYALAVEAKKLAITVIGVTVDHQLQQQSSQQAELVKQQLTDLNIICLVKKVTVDIQEPKITLARDDGSNAMSVTVPTSQNTTIYMTQGAMDTIKNRVNSGGSTVITLIQK